MVNEIVLDFQGLTTAWDAHEYLKTVLGFPDHYGHNLDALWDCVYLWFDQPTVLKLKNLTTFPIKNVREGLIAVFKDLDEKDPNVQVVFAA